MLNFCQLPYHYYISDIQKLEFIISINALDRGNQSGNASGSGEVMNYRHGRSIDVSPDSEDGRLRRMRGKESIFKKPELPIGRCLKPRKTPDYQVRDYP